MAEVQEAAPPQVVGYDVAGGVIDRIARRYGLSIARNGGPAALVLLGQVDTDRIKRALATGAAAVVEVDENGELPARAVERLTDTSGIFLSLLTRTAYAIEAPMLMAQALQQRGAVTPSTRSSLELAVHEAVTNAIVHGNLGIERGPADDPASFARFFSEVKTRLGQPEIARRRVSVTATWDQTGLEVDVSDEGKGYLFGGIVDAKVVAKSGRGLQIMRELATAVSVSNGGRCLTLRFAR